MDYERIFDEYYKQFDDNEYWINYKYNHIMRVRKYANIVAKSLNLSEEDLKLVDVCALFHDISRFKQYATYHNFQDAMTFDHGDEGYNVLKELGITDNVILMCTKNHNKIKIDDSLDEKTKLMLSNIRDADKLDIMIDLYNELEDDKAIKVTDEIYEYYKHHQQLKNGMDTWDTSLFNMLRCIAFIFDLNYPASFDILKSQDIINLKFNNILKRINDPRVNELREIINNYINERMSD